MSKDKKTQKPLKADKSKKVSKTARNDSDELDFGGFPDRDLKKNLGCG